MARVAAMFPEIEDRFGDPAWREMVMTEARSWRDILDAMPGDASQIAKDVHTRTLRWFAFAPEVGDDIATGVETANPERLALGVSKLPGVTALADDATRSAAVLAEQVS